MKRMQCANEQFTEREFTPCGSYEGRTDYSCTHCGWLQYSAAAGAAELCRHATWHSIPDYERFRDVARAGGHDVPDAPPNYAA